METNILFLIGFVLIFLGIVIIIASAILSTKAKVEGGFVGFIGPFPIGFGTSKEILLFSLLITITILVIVLLMNIRLI